MSKHDSPENIEHWHLTSEQIRAYPQFAKSSDEEIENSINSLHEFSLITYAVVSKELIAKNTGSK